MARACQITERNVSAPFASVPREMPVMGDEGRGMG